jgi:hypothetical protein
MRSPRNKESEERTTVGGPGAPMLQSYISTSCRPLRSLSEIQESASSQRGATPLRWRADFRPIVHQHHVRHASAIRQVLNVRKRFHRNTNGRYRYLARTGTGRRLILALPQDFGRANDPKCWSSVTDALSFIRARKSSLAVAERVELSADRGFSTP